MALENPDIRRQESWLKRNKKTLTGAFYGVGDIAIAARAIVLGLNEEKGSKERKTYFAESTTGIGYLAGAGVMGKYGNWAIDDQMEVLQENLAYFFAEKGVTLTSDYVAKEQKHNQKGFAEKLSEFLYRYPTEVLNACYFVSTIPSLYSGMQEFNKDKNNYGTLGSAVMIMAGALAGILIKEKPKDQSKGGILGWIQEKPNRIPGALYMGNNLFSAQKALYDKKHYADKTLRGEGKVSLKNLWLFRGVQTANYVAANGLLMTTSQGTESGSDEIEKLQNAIFEQSATMLRNQPKEAQENLIESTAEYLSERKELNIRRLGKNEIIAKLTEALEKGKPSAADNWVGRAKQTPAGFRKGV